MPHRRPCSAALWAKASLPPAAFSHSMRRVAKGRTTIIYSRCARCRILLSQKPPPSAASHRAPGSLLLPLNCLDYVPPLPPALSHSSICFPRRTVNACPATLPPAGGVPLRRNIYGGYRLPLSVACYFPPPCAAPLPPLLLSFSGLLVAVPFFGFWARAARNPGHALLPLCAWRAGARCQISGVLGVAGSAGRAPPAIN